jgi:hypothetical protein
MEPNVSAIERDQAMCELRRLGVGLERISELARVSKGRVSQIVNRARQENAA